MNKYCLAFLAVVTMLSGVVVSHAQQPQEQPQYGAILTVKHMCCAKESVPAIKELSKVTGVKRVAVSYKTRSLYIETTNVNPSPQALWDAVDRIKIGPIRLATNSGVYTARPE
jgi:hypothetical protein